MFSTERLLEVLSYWNCSKHFEISEDQGLINYTWMIGNPISGVLQWVNPIFSPLVNDDICSIASEAKRRGLLFPEIIPTKEGGAYLVDPKDGGTWRIISFIEGKTIHTIKNSEISTEAGRLVGQFHAAFWDYQHDWVSPRRYIHNTPERIEDLRKALEKADGHHLEIPARDLGEKIINDWENWTGTMELPTHLCHGDLKISNLRFDENGKGLCLLDLDTLGEADFSVEMGDAWRSWCNPVGESDPEAVRFDRDIFESSAKSWLSQLPMITQIEKESLVAGIERICLELSARFCADAINNSYFKEDREKYPVVGEHNLRRARTQYKLAKSVSDQKSECERIIFSV